MEKSIMLRSLRNIAIFRFMIARHGAAKGKAAQGKAGQHKGIKCIALQNHDGMAGQRKLVQDEVEQRKEAW